MYTKTYYVFKRIGNKMHPYANIHESPHTFCNGTCLAEASKFQTVPSALKALVHFVRQRPDHALIFHSYLTTGAFQGRSSVVDDLELVKVFETTGEPTQVRRILKDCEGCEDGETAMFAYQLVNTLNPEQGLDRAKLFYTIEDAIKNYRVYDECRLVRVAIRTGEGEKYITESKLM